MSYCKCGGYLGSGGVDGYSGRWCRCVNPVANTPVAFSSNKISLAGEASAKKDRSLDQEIESLRKDREKLVEVVKELRSTLEMVEDNSKMPHQHTDLQTRLYCLAERAREVLARTTLKELGEME